MKEEEKEKAIVLHGSNCDSDLQEREQYEYVDPNQQVVVTRVTYLQFQSIFVQPARNKMLDQSQGSLSLKVVQSQLVDSIIYFSFGQE